MRLWATALVLGATMLGTLLPASVAGAVTGQIERVNVDDDGVELDGGGGMPDITPDGRFVAFVSSTTRFGDSSGSERVYVRDRQLGTTELVSRDENGAVVAGGDPRITPDGRYVVYVSGVPNTNDRNIFVYDRETQTAELVSRSSGGTPGIGRNADPVISDDGNSVVFDSDADNLVPGDAPGTDDVFLRDRAAGTTTLVSATADGIHGNGHSDDADISGDGSTIVFESQATNLVANDTDPDKDVYRRDRSGALTLVSTGVSREGNDYRGDPMLSADGSTVAFYGWRSFNFDSERDVFVRHGTDAPELIARDAGAPSLSPDGRFVAYSAPFESDGEVYLRDRQDGHTELLTPGATPGATGRGSTDYTSISDGGALVAFDSNASGILPTSYGYAMGAFVFDRGLGGIADGTVSLRQPPAAPTGLTAAAGDGRVALGWQRPVSDGDSPVDSYDVLDADGKTLAHVRFGTSTTIDGLTNGKSYTFRVRALTRAGFESVSAPSDPVTPEAGLTAPAAVSETVTGGTVTTDAQGAGPSPGMPVTSSVTLPAGSTGVVRIAQAAVSPTAPAPTGYRFVGQQADIHVLTPDGSRLTTTASDPLTLAFSVDPSVIPAAGIDALSVFRDGQLVPDCVGGALDAAAADPVCVLERTAPTATTPYGKITLLSTHASAWNLGVASDAVVPSSAATAPATSNGTTWSVDYAASDPAPSSGLARVELWAKGPGDAGYRKVATDSTPTAAGRLEFTAAGGEGAYAFYTVAVDEAGNAEAAADGADARTLLDTTAPKVAFTGAQPTYSVDQTVSIACTASDPAGANGAAGSGIASSSCPDVNAPAYILVGANTRSATAADRAGNSAAATVAFTVQVTASGLCRLTRNMVQASPKYLALTTRARAAIDASVTGICQGLDTIVPRLKPADRTAAVNRYRTAVGGLVKAGWLTNAQGTTLTGLAAAL